MTVQLSGTGGKHPIDGPVTPNSTAINDTMFVNGMTVNSTVACGDCHGMNGGGPRGPHGSSYQFILKGADTTIVSGGTPTNSDITNQWWLVQNICINCHDASVYGLGGPTTSGSLPVVPSRNNLSPVQHYSGNTFREDRCGNIDGVDAGGVQIGTKQPIGCTQCHAGAGQNYGAHSSTFGTVDTQNPPGKWSNPGGAGFMNGNSWTAAPSGSGGKSCYATSGTTTWTTCNKGYHG
jgi:hypothetical protein